MKERRKEKKKISYIEMCSCVLKKKGQKKGGKEGVELKDVTQPTLI